MKSLLIYLAQVIFKIQSFLGWRRFISPKMASFSLSESLTGSHVGALTQTSSGSAVVDTSAIRALADDATIMGKEAAELVGTFDDLFAQGQRQTDACSRLTGDVQHMVTASQAISEAMSLSLRSANTARDAVERVASDVSAAAQTLHQVAQVATEITAISLQTRLVAFNASVEAKRAGEAGRGFAVVAEAIKDLSKKVEQSSNQIAVTVSELDKRIKDLAQNLRDSKIVKGQETFGLAFSQVEDAIKHIANSAQGNMEACNSVRTSVAAMSGQVREQGSALEQAKNRAMHFLSSSEHLIELAADCGAETADTPFISKVCEISAAISSRFEQALKDQEIHMNDLFDDNYIPISNTNPQQLHTRFVEFTDRILPAFQEPMLNFSKKVVFCAAVDRNGYLPTHNLKFSKPQGQNLVWNAVNCRNRRLFNDRTGLSAGRNNRRFLLQTYRRDMGGGQFVLMKDLSAPIFVQGRHWGGLRLAYHF